MRGLVRARYAPANVRGARDPTCENALVNRDGTNGLPITTRLKARWQHGMRARRHNGIMSTTTEIAPTTGTDIDRPWIVIVWNDPINLMSYVTWVFQKLFGYSLEKATALMLDVHEKGRAVVSNGTRERAEVDVQRLHEYGLWATMQREDA